MASAATGDGDDRDLNLTTTKETTTSEESESGDILTKRKEAMMDLAGGLLATNKPTAEAQPAGAGTKRKEATGASSEAGDYHDRDPKRKEASASEDDAAAALKKKVGDSLWKEGEMLKLREELWEAEHLWSEKLVQGVLDHWMERKTTQVPTGDKKSNKKRKVVRVILPDACIDYIIANDPCMMRELSDEEMAECREEYRQSYDIAKVINAKNLAYQHALIAQYCAFGYAYDEKEITDEEEEEEEEVVVKN